MSELKQFIIDGDNEISLAISNGVFVPTGTSRVLIKAVKEYVSRQGKVLDLGSGSGIVGISLFRLGLVKPPLYASDLSTQAIDCLIENAKLYNCPVIAKSGSLFEPWKNETFMLHGNTKDNENPPSPPLKKGGRGDFQVKNLILLLMTSPALQRM